MTHQNKTYSLDPKIIKLIKEIKHHSEAENTLSEVVSDGVIALAMRDYNHVPAIKKALRSALLR
jgi:hypothetical protein